MTDIDDLAKSMRDTHDKIEAKCAQTVLAVELVALQHAVTALTRRIAALERSEHNRKQTQDAKHEDHEP